MSETMQQTKDKLPRFVHDNELGNLLWRWWDRLSDNPGFRAELRRRRTPAEVRLDPRFYTLVSAMEKAGYKANRWRLSMVVGVLSHARSDYNGARLGILLRGARFHEMRFKRLISMSNEDLIYANLIRAVKVLNGAVPIRELADLAYWWNERAKEELAYDFYLET